jgi:hypothetical protein
MATTSSIVDEKNGKGHTDHGNGKGLGHLKHEGAATEDGVYEIDIANLHTDGSAILTGDGLVTSTVLADGSTFYTNARAGSIDSTSQGLLFDTDSGNGRLRAGVTFDADNQLLLGDLHDVSFDFKVTGLDAGSDGRYSPAFRITVDGDGDLSTTADRGQLVYEFAYNNSGNVPIGTLLHVDVDQSVVWQRSNGQNLDSTSNLTTFSDYADANGYKPSGGVLFDSHSVVLGFEIGLGSGPGSGSAFVDNVQVGGVHYDF